MRLDHWSGTDRGVKQATLPMIIYPSQISCRLDWDGKRALQVKDKRLTARATLPALDLYHFIPSYSTERNSQEKVEIN
jgi:hypothetical protein